jgi:hypothetical protein
MANTDAFSAQIVKLVRDLPDEAILALIKNQLGSVTSASSLSTAAPRRRGRPPRAAVAAVAAAPVAAKAAPAKKARKARAAKATARPGRPRKTAALSAERQETLNAVEKIVKAGSGVSASDVARLAGIAQTRAAAALKELKLAKRIFQGGDRRFARYAGDAKTAEQASLNARKTASGPSVTAKKAGKRGGKRSKVAAV